MEKEIKVSKNVNIKTLEVSAGVRYWEDGTVNGQEDTNGDLIPCRDGDTWRPIIDIDTGKILNWKEGVEADIHYKVCDYGRYTLKDDAGNEIISKEGYVPDIMCPEENGYGDYIIMKIGKDGQIENWDSDIDEFFE